MKRGLRDKREPDVLNERREFERKQRVCYEGKGTVTGQRWTKMTTSSDYSRTGTIDQIECTSTAGLFIEPHGYVPIPLTAKYTQMMQIGDEEMAARGEKEGSGI